MKLRGYIILVLLLSLLSSTASYAQEKDSVKIAVDDLAILGEGCIRQTSLEKDTTLMGVELRYAYMLTYNYERQISNLEEQNHNYDIANANLATGLKACKEDLKKATRKANGLKMGFITITPVALIGGIWLGTKFGN